MFPVYDDVPKVHFPWATATLLVLTSYAFFLQLSLGPAGNLFIERWGLIPARLVAPDEPIVVPAQGVVATLFGPAVVNGFRTIPQAGVSDWFTVLSSLFLHGGWLHFLGNMWFLFLFGRSVEDRLGPAIYTCLYLGSGIVAGLTHATVDLSSAVPTVGASGAIAGVLGAYVWLFPHARVAAVIPIVFLFPVVELPAWVFLGLWFLTQFWQGLFSIVAVEAGGVAWWAHIGGFVAGFLVAYSLVAVQKEEEAKTEPPWTHEDFQ